LATDPCTKPTDLANLSDTVYSIVAIILFLNHGKYKGYVKNQNKDETVGLPVLAFSRNCYSAAMFVCTVSQLVQAVR